VLLKADKPLPLVLTALTPSLLVLMPTTPTSVSLLPNAPALLFDWANTPTLESLKADKPLPLVLSFTSKVIAIGRLGNALGGLKDQFGLTIAPAFTAFFDRLTEIVIANRDAIVEFGQILGSLLKPLEGVAILLNGLVIAFATLFATVAQGINAAFGTNVTTAQVFAGAVALIVLQLARVPAAIALIVTARCAP
jgi:hypothetical protein